MLLCCIFAGISATRLRRKTAHFAVCEFFAPKRNNINNNTNAAAHVFYFQSHPRAHFATWNCKASPVRKANIYWRPLRGVRLSKQNSCAYDPRLEASQEHAVAEPTAQQTAAINLNRTPLVFLLGDTHSHCGGHNSPGVNQITQLVDGSTKSESPPWMSPICLFIINY